LRNDTFSVSTAETNFENITAQLKDSLWMSPLDLCVFTIYCFL